jgi:uncharacterized Zn finger protein (UPF0148 family)
VVVEIRKGGSEAPCPFCHLPRVRRTDYIRCSRCGINWLEGEDLDHDPRGERQNKLRERERLAQVSQPKPPAEEKPTEGARRTR